MTPAQIRSRTATVRKLLVELTSKMHQLQAECRHPAEKLTGNEITYCGVLYAEYHCPDCRRMRSDEVVMVGEA